MATKTQSIICRRLTALERCQFSHKDQKYKFAGWSTTRERANAGIIDYADQASIIASNNTNEIELYASWKERDTKISYEDLRITASDVAYDQTTAPVNYTITQVKTYEGISTPYSKITLTNDEPQQSQVFGPNGDAQSENATSPRKITVSYIHPESGLKATTTITQSGYTPIFKIICQTSKYGKITCTQDGKAVSFKDNGDGTVTYYGNSKNFTLTATANEIVETYWNTKRGCAYYSKDYQTRLKHAAAYPGSNSCGSWTTIRTKLYNFSTWSGLNINGSTSSTVVVAGTVVNPPVYAANYKRIPLLTNTVIGDWRPTWTTTKTETYTYTAYRTTYSWVPTCKTGRKYLAKYGISTMHEGRNGHGYYKTSSVPYLATGTKNISTPHTNKYYGAAHVDAPYTIYIPEDGVLKIKGKYGIDVYGCSCKRVGGFKILKYSDKQNVFDDFLDFSTTLDKTDASFYKELKVKKGEKYQFSATYSTSLKHIAIWIDSIELAEMT